MNATIRPFVLLLALASHSASALAQDHERPVGDLSHEQLRSRVDQGIRQLGANSFRQREDAQKQLIQVAEDVLFQVQLDDHDLSTLDRYDECVLAPLLEAAKSEDREVRVRATAILWECHDGLRRGSGAAAWALYAVAYDLPSLPEPLRYKELSDIRRWQVQLSLITAAEHNPSAAAHWLMNEYSAQDAIDAVNALARAWTMRDARAAARWSQTLAAADGRTGVYRQYAASEVIQHWPHDLPLDEAERVLDVFPKGEQHSLALDAVCAIAARKAYDDPQAAMRWAEEQEWTDAHANVYSAIIRAVADKSTQTALKLAKAAPANHSGDYARRQAAIELARRGVVVDETMMNDIGSGSNSPGVAYHVVQSFLQRDKPDAAIQYYKTIAVTRSAGDISAYLAKHDIEAAKEWVQTLKKNSVEAHSHAMQALVEELAQNKLQEAKSYVEQVKDPTRRGRCWQRAAEGLAEKDPPAALNLVDDFERQHSDTASRARKRIIQRWAELDPEQAAKWVQSQPVDGNSVRWHAIVGHKWAQVFPAQACEWAAALPRGEMRAAALVGVADGLTSEQNVMGLRP